MSPDRSWRPDGATRRGLAALGVVDGLALAAAPTFALMAVATAGSHAMALCAPVPPVLSIDSMTAMYLLMSLFHLSPWLALARRRPSAAEH